MKQRRMNKGFTLIELLIVVVIIGILAAIVYPSYQNYVRKAARAEARSILLENAQILERNFTAANRYDAINMDGTGGAPTLIGQSPKTGTKKYDVATTTLTQTSYTLAASPDSAGMMASDECGTLTLDNTGAKGVSGSSMSAEDCWK
jgi:type IV pilus assembly protein PilE